MRVRVNGVSLFFEVEGSRLASSGRALRERPTIVALHGGPGLDHTDLRAGLAPLATRAQVVYLDQRGNGRSDRSTPEHWNLATWGDDVRGFCDALEIEQPVVLGNSFGGMVALAYAIRHPGHAGKLVLHSTTAHFELEPALATFARLGGPGAADVARRFFADPSGEIFGAYVAACLPLYHLRPAQGTTGPAPVVHLDVARHFVGGEWHTFDFRSQLATIACPTLVLAGEEDPVFPTACSDALAAGIRPELLRFERFPGCGHALLVDCPERVCEAVASFVDA